MLEIALKLLPIIGALIIVFIFKYIYKKLNVKTIIFSPILMICMFFIFNKLSSNIFFEMFGDSIEFAIFTFTIMTSLVYVMFMFEKIAESSEDDDDSSAILKIGTMVISSCIYFALIYLSYYRLSDHRAFSGTIGEDFITQIISFIYFSLVTFTTVGYGDIQPISNFARLTVMIQIVIAFITVIYGISSFSHFKALFKLNSPFSVNKKNKKLSEDSEEE